MIEDAQNQVKSSNQTESQFVEIVPLDEIDEDETVSAMPTEKSENQMNNTPAPQTEPQTKPQSEPVPVNAQNQSEKSNDGSSGGSQSSQMEYIDINFFN